MKVFRLILCFFVMLTLVSCGKNELVDISGFIDNYNKLSSTSLDLTDFIIQKNPEVSYTAVLSENGCNILLSASQKSDKKMQSCKIALTKEIGSVPTKDEQVAFNSVIIKAMTAYCDFTTAECNDVINSFGLIASDFLSKNGELTLKKDNYFFIYYSTPIISEFIIHNTYLKEIETTHKPENKPYYGEDFVIKDKETP